MREICFQLPAEFGSTVYFLDNQNKLMVGIFASAVVCSFGNYIYVTGGHNFKFDEIGQRVFFSENEARKVLNLE